MARKIEQTYTVKDDGSKQIKSATNNVNKSLDDVEKKSKQTTDQMQVAWKKVIGVLAILGGMNAVKNLITDTINYADELGKLNDRLGVNVNTMDKMVKIAGRSNITFDKLTSSIEYMGRQVVIGNERIAQLGLTTEELLKLTPDEQFRKMASAIERIENPTMKAAVAAELFGRANADIVQMMPDLNNKFDEYNSNMSLEKTNAAQEYNNTMSKMGETLRDIAITVVPILNTALQTMWELLNNIFATSVAQRINMLNTNIANSQQRIKDLQEIIKKGGGVFGNEIEGYSYYSKKNMDQAYEDLKREEEQLKTNKTLRDQLLNPSSSTTTGSTAPIVIPTGRVGDNDAQIKAAQDRDRKLLDLGNQHDVERLKLQGRTLEAMLLAEQIRYGKEVEMIKESLGEHEDKYGVLTSAHENYEMRMTAITKDYNDKRLEATNKAIDEAVELYANLTKIVEEEIDPRIQRIQENIASGMTDALHDFVMGTKSAEEAFADMATSIISYIFKMVIAEMALKAVKGIMSGMSSGGVVDEPYVPGAMGMASGGVIDQPTWLGTSGGVPAYGGEAGPEGVLPLKRGASGNLGVEASGVIPTMEIVLHNSGEKMEMTRQQQKFDGSKMVIEVWLDAYNRNVGGLRDAIGR